MTTPHPTLALIEQRISANRFDDSHSLADAEIARLVQLATRAPTAYNLQNWRFIAVRTPAAKARLRALAQDQAKVQEAAVCFIVCGVLADPEALAERLQPFVDGGFMPAAMAQGWLQAAQQQYASAQAVRDEALRSASFGAMTLMHAAQAMGLASCAMTGFDAEGVTSSFGLASEEVPVMLVTVGRAAAGNWPQKPRRPLEQVLEFA
ncbi:MULTISPECIES: nitroreductase family protein [Comamonas]|uniref:NAD(P)H nitroreductase n=1 Tax=Comamonas thiooxydans TaxID=363952 RepID=A0A096FJM9_9BURK|nr:MULTISPECIES: nitroreductase family protein [Comamonas]KGG86310.1 NAD(P)H nitroreductase [Comamonas thiooxydans]KGG97939.1 NAD(P)H nitroreductase [Comamonas thiooxydans]KGH06569.1 NAD(P)H nitroreductase [Comamonas thiooxydans]KGH08957.1 NAD(P)H nitroreductase [Comamonas thiooxydans]KGH21919.1 NAD(P)H nitroreductase [Comamonas thiooxydans]